MNDPNDIVFSVIIPNYNRALVISKAINSVLEQTYEHFEIIVVDDCSTDNSLEILSKIEDKRLRVVKLEKNLGAAGARNFGIQESKGKYISLLDSDDHYEPNFLEKTYKAITTTNKNVGFCWTGVRYIEDNGISEFIWLPVYKKDAYNTFLHSLHIGTNSGVTFKKNVFEIAGYFNEDLPAAEDTEFFLRITKKFDFLVIPEILINIERDNPDRLSKNFTKIALAYNRFIHLHREEIDRDKKLQLKYYYKLMWLNYHLEKKENARKFFNLIPGNSNATKIKAFFIKALYENLPLSVAGNLHRKFSI